MSPGRKKMLHEISTYSRCLHASATAIIPSLLTFWHFLKNQNLAKKFFYPRSKYFKLKQFTTVNIRKASETNLLHSKKSIFFIFGNVTIFLKCSNCCLSSITSGSGISFDLEPDSLSTTLSNLDARGR
jgi:hypothetical protein